MPPSGKDCHDSDQCEAGPLVIIRLWQRAAHHLPRRGLRLSAIGQVALTWDSARRSVVNACLAPSRGVDTRRGGRVCPCPPGAQECKPLQSASSRRDDAGRNRRHADEIGAIKLEAGPRYHLQRFAPICAQMHRLMSLAPDGQQRLGLQVPDRAVSVVGVPAPLERGDRLSLFETAD